MREGVGGAVEEVGIAEGDVLRAGGDLRADVGEHDVGVHGAEAAVVDRHDRAVAAAMLAAARRLGVADDPPLVADLERGVLRQRRQIGSIGRDELHAPDGPVGPTFRSGVFGRIATCPT